MEELNPHAQAVALRVTLAKSAKIKELGIKPDLTDKQINVLIEKLAKAKNPDKWEKEIKGQRWYVEDLVSFSALPAQSRLDLEYKKAFPDCASESEGLLAVELLMAA